MSRALPYLDGRDAERWASGLTRLGPKAAKRRHQRCVHLAMRRIDRLHDMPCRDNLAHAVRALELATTSGIASGLESGRAFTLAQLGLTEDRG